MKNKVTQKQIDNIIKHSRIDVKTVFNKVTLVTCKLPNGFVLVESSGAVDKSNYDVEIGKETCMTRITNKIWELEGYSLANQLIKKVN
ncbi:Gp49 family protein [Companilactobacillus baiquanensis]|uniref:Gp49 family protein n=1 Tax=Companilactobacillus baiquanensis TaxID=2486005 RepID=A0ABW1UX55_9LACO|nr:Gp49 family protein [Companilactobacillus baiquanensis]